MSYPPQQGQDPNNPYAQQPQQGGQPGYGYPQQGGQPGYGYPQQQGGLPSYSGQGGYPPAGYGAPMSMPGGVKAARVMLFVVGGLSTIGAGFVFLAAAAIGTVAANEELQNNNSDLEMLSGLGAGLIALIGVVYLGFAVAGIVLGAKFGKGAGRLRIGTIVYGALVAVVGIIGFPLGLLFTILAILIIVFVAKSDGNAWFNRPRA